MLKFSFALSCVVLCSAIVAMDLYHFMDFHQNYFNHRPDDCETVKGNYFGSEDFEILSDGLMFITSGLASSISSPKIWEFFRKNDNYGRILLLDLSQADTNSRKPNANTSYSSSGNSIIELKIKPSDNFKTSTFHPHGISVLEDKTVKGEHLIYVVNHVRGGKDRIEKFKFLPDDRELEHVRSFSSSFINIANDLAVVGEDKFYFTNCAYATIPLIFLMEQIFRFPWHDVVYFDGSIFQIAVPSLSGPNGITVSKDGKFVYVAMALTKGIKVFERFQNGSLAKIQDISLGTAVDNFHLSEDGKALFSGNHPITLKLINHIDDPTTKSPSQVLHYPLKSGRIEEDKITELLYDDGSFLSASTVATVYQKNLFIGTFMGKLFRCKLPR